MTRMYIDFIYLDNENKQNSIHWTNKVLIDRRCSHVYIFITKKPTQLKRLQITPII